MLLERKVMKSTLLEKARKQGLFLTHQIWYETRPVKENDIFELQFQTYIFVPYFSLIDNKILKISAQESTKTEFCRGLCIFESWLSEREEEAV